MVTKPARELATYKDVLTAPENMVAEVLCGELVLSPRPGVGHARAGSRLNSILLPAKDPFDGGRGSSSGWWILVEPELHLGPHILVPDIAGWKVSTLAELPNEPHIEVPPDWVCEILSPRTAARDRVQKLAIYAEQRVSWAWLVDPDAHTLEVFRRESQNWIRTGAWSDAATVHAEPFEDVEIDLDSLWLRSIKSTQAAATSKGPTAG